MKIILPSLKEKKRYLAFEIFSDNSFSKSEVFKAIKENALIFMGQLNYGKAGLMIINTNGKKGILRVHNKFVNHLKTSLMLIKDINNKKLSIKTNKVSGILNKLKGDGN
jgi:ribonuclease P/MRP protein subunit POP5